MEQHKTRARSEAAASSRQVRSAPRETASLSAKLRVEGGRAVTTRVRNLSTGGIMADYAAPLIAGTPVEIDLRGLGLVSGTIAWSTDGRIGISFDRPVDPSLARRQSSRPARGSAYGEAGVAHG